MNGRLAAVVGGARPPGVYRWLSRAHPEAVRRELTAAAWATHAIDGRRVTGRQQLFDRCAHMLAFPAWFGHSWDGLVDCLGDLSWLSAGGHVVLWDRFGVLARADPKAWRLAYQTFADATAVRYRTAAPPLYLLLRGPGPAEQPDGDGTIPAL